MIENKRNIAILGSTGSIGTQALSVIRNHSRCFQIELLTANNNADLLILQSLEFKPNTVVITNKDHYDKVFSALDPEGIKVYCGADAIGSCVQMDSIDLVLTAMVGFAGLIPTVKALEAGKTIALANKETLVVAGQIITDIASKNRAAIIPVDSEHSAIFQCIMGETQNQVEKVILTASGGPFRGKSKEFLKNVTRQQALQHPNWSMGAKITIDSATFMNKGLEVIEAKWLFNLSPEQIEVVVHPQSIIHSMVQFEDSSIKAQMGLPDMRLPIQFALAFPKRLKSDFERFNFLNYPSLTFEAPNHEAFPCLRIAYKAIEQEGNKPCILNAANEVAVKRFLSDQITFTEIPEIIQSCLDKLPYIAEPSLQDLVDCDKETRRLAEEIKKQEIFKTGV